METKFSCRAEDKVREAVDAADAADLSVIGEVIPAVKAQSMMHHFDLSVACGLPIAASADEGHEMVDVMDMVCPNRKDSYIIHVRGNSMIDDDIHNGDIIVVDRSVTSICHGEPMLCELNGEYTVKFVEKDSMGYRLVAANAMFADREVDETDSFFIRGLVTWVMHKPRRM